MLAGLAGLLVGPDPAFRWTLYFLLSLWPVSIYLGARLFGSADGRRRGRRNVAVPDQRDWGRLRAERLRLDGIRRLDTTVGVVHVTARMGAQLASDPQRPPPIRSRIAGFANDCPAFRDRLSRARPIAGVAVGLGGRSPPAPVARQPSPAGRCSPRRGSSCRSSPNARRQRPTRRSGAPRWSTVTAPRGCSAGSSPDSSSTPGGSQS